MNYQELYNRFVTKEKSVEERYNIIDAYLFRPISIYASIPISKTNITPTSITQLSLVCSVIGFVLLAFGNSILIKILGCFCFFLWALLDEIDGNIARYTNQCSLLGELWDTMGGYAAIILMYFGAGIAAFYDMSAYEYCEKYWLLIFGGATAIFSIFPRLMMHKKKSLVGMDNGIKSMSDKQSFGTVSIIGMNIVSPTGFVQFFLLFSVMLHYLNVFIMAYLLVNLGIMVIALFRLLK